MDTDTWIQILDEAVCISHNVNTLAKSMNTTILTPAMGKIVGQTGSLALVWQPVHEKENSEFKPVKLRIKNIYFVLHPARAEGLVDTYIYIHIYIYNMKAVQSPQITAVPHKLTPPPSVYLHLGDQCSYNLGCLNASFHRDQSLFQEETIICSFKTPVAHALIIACFQVVKFAYVSTPSSPLNFFVRKVSRWKDFTGTFLHHGTIMVNTCAIRISLSKSSLLSSVNQ